MYPTEMSAILAINQLEDNERAIVAWAKRNDGSEPPRMPRAAPSTPQTNESVAELKINQQRDKERTNCAEPAPGSTKQWRVMGKPIKCDCSNTNCAFSMDMLDSMGIQCVNPIKRCSGCKQVAYCSVRCQRDDWVRHRLECKRAGSRAPAPDLRLISTATLPELSEMLLSIARYDITPGFSRSSFLNSHFETKTQEIGSRIFDLGGVDGMLAAHELVRKTFEHDPVRSNDAKMLSIAWSICQWRGESGVGGWQD